jgi:hypothetical protein
MWFSRPNALLDGIIFVTAYGLALSAIVIIKGASNGEQYLAPLCQEVVVAVEKKGNVLAQCPPGTRIEIDETANVVCRCSDRRMPIMREPSFMFNDPMPTIPAPFLPHDDKGIEL